MELFQSLPGRKHSCSGHPLVFIRTHAEIPGQLPHIRPVYLQPQGRRILHHRRDSLHLPGSLVLLLRTG